MAQGCREAISSKVLVGLYVVLTPRSFKSGIGFGENNSCLGNRIKHGGLKPKMNNHIGSNFDDLLEQEDLLAEAEALAIKRVIAFQVAELMKSQKISKVAMAKRMKTSRSALGPSGSESALSGKVAVSY